MTMFKRNKAVQVDADASKKEAVPKIKSDDTGQKNKLRKQKTPKKAKIQSLTGWVVQPLFAAAFCLVLAYVLMELLFLKPLDESHQTKIAESQALSIEFSVSRYFQVQLDWLAGLSTVVPADEPELEPLLKKIKPELQSLRVISLEELSRLDPQTASLSFASLDLLRRTAKGEKNTIEAFLQEQQWLFQIALPVYKAQSDAQSTDQSMQALVLAIFDMSGLEKLLREKQAQFKGQISLLTNGVSKPIIQLGSGRNAAMLDKPTAIAQWRVQYAPAEQNMAHADRANVWLVFGVTIILMVILLLLIVRMNMKIVQRDLQSAVRMISKAVESDANFLNNFHYGEVYAMAHAVVGHLREIIAHQKKRISKLQTVTATKEETVELSEDEPLFDDDLFDLDAIDSDSVDLEASTGAIVQEKSSLELDVSPSIFRAYDIRGIVNETLSAGIIELLGKSIASEALAQGQKSLCIGYDGRLSSLEYCDALAQGVVSTGMNAIIVGRVPTPVLYFSTHHFETGTGVMITGSHNPSQYNGLKIMIAGTTLSGEAIQKIYNRIMTQDFAEGRGERSEQLVERAYIDTILNDIAVAAPLKVVLDAGNGVAGGLAPELIEELGCEVIPLHCDVDGNFPNHHPDPGKPENLQDLIAAVKEHQADIGLAFDGDGDRLGVVTNTGKIIWPDRLLMLFAKDVVSRNPGADIIYDVKCSRRLNGLISSYGGRPVMWKTGHSLIKAKMKETGALLAGEMSGHIFFKERWFGFDDGLYSAARLLEILGVEDKSSDEVFAGFPEDVSTPEINIAVTDDSKFDIVEKLCARREQFVGGNVSTIDGIRVDYPNGWGLCRASNTTPMLVLRFEADDQTALDEIKQKFVAQLQQIEPDLNCDF